MSSIDWKAAQRIGELLGGTPPRGTIALDQLQPLADDFARRVSEYSGLSSSGPLPTLESVDRSEWVAANLATMRPLLDPLIDRANGRLRRGGLLSPLTSAARTAQGMLLGAQVGGLAGMLSQRVLGQYDIALLDASAQPRLLLLAPNLVAAAKTMGVERKELVEWVTIHEVTHAVQFGGAPWLRGHLAGLLAELLDGVSFDSTTGALSKLADLDELRRLAKRAREGDLLRLTLGEERWQLVDRMQATMSLIEGHAEHVMDVVGADVLASLPRLRAAMNRRRESRGLPWRVLERLLGLELKMRQYEVGRRFCDEVVASAGPTALARAWGSAEALPSTAELADVPAWLARTHVLPVTS